MSLAECTFECRQLTSPPTLAAEAREEDFIPAGRQWLVGLARACICPAFPWRGPSCQVRCSTGRCPGTLGMEDVQTSGC
jgi:hypothetical protein